MHACSAFIITLGSVHMRQGPDKVLAISTPVASVLHRLSTS